MKITKKGVKNMRSAKCSMCSTEFEYFQRDTIDGYIHCQQCLEEMSSGPKPSRSMLMRLIDILFYRLNKWFKAHPWAAILVPALICVVSNIILGLCMYVFHGGGQ